MSTQRALRNTVLWIGLLAFGGGPSIATEIIVRNDSMNARLCERPQTPFHAEPLQTWHSKHGDKLGIAVASPGGLDGSSRFRV